MQRIAGPLLLLAHRVHVLGARPPAGALLIEDGRVRVVGTAAECRAAAPPGCRSLKVEGVVTPGLTDAHVHFTSWALGRRRVRLGDARNVEAGADRVAEYAAQSADEWVQGGGWDLHRWGRLPNRRDLDRVLPDRPVYLESHDTHAAWLNTDALRRCGIDRDTADPPGGRIVRDPGTGEPSGVLLENAKALAVTHLPPVDAGAVSEALVDAQAEAHRHGITGVHSVEVTGLADFARLEREGRLSLRVLQHLPLADLDAAVEIGLSSGWRSPGSPGGEGWIRIGGIKIFLDGALGSRTAWMREPYEGTENDYGISTLDPDEFRSILLRMQRAGFSAAVHAIGDAAVGLALNELASVAPSAGIPHRIEHLQLCPPEWWERAAGAGIVASMQPVHLRTDIPAAERHWGARARGAYAFRPLLRAGTILAFGSDIPVETIDPRQGMYAAVRRVDWKGDPRGGWYPEHAISAEEALRAYTEGPGRAAGAEDSRGRLLPGYDADLVVWDRDPVTCPAEELLEMEPLLVTVGGETVFAAAGLDG